MPDILTIGKSALAAAQIGIKTTGHNIANANTEGYSRQVVTQRAKAAQNFSYGYVGQGTDVASVNRVYNEIYAKQLLTAQTNNESIQAYQTQIAPIDDLLSDPEAGLNPALNNFFASVKGTNANAGDIPTRQSMIASSQSLANRINTMSNRLSQMQEDVNLQISGHVTSANSIATQISRLNEVINNAISADANTPNDLMDQRDNLVSELSKIIKTTVVEQGQGSYNIFVGNGLPLVIGGDRFELAAIPSPTDPTRLEVGYKSKNKVTALGTASIAGGKLGGLVKFREETLDATQNKIGQIALVLADKFNTQHKSGFDLNGDAGVDFFSVPAPVTTAHSGNTGTAILSSAIVDASQVTSSDYRIKYDGTNYNIIRSTDNKTTSFGSLPQTVDGLSFTIDSGGMVAGDDFLIQPTKKLGDSFKLAVTDPNKIAMAGSNTTGPADNENGLLLSKLQLDTIIQGPNDAVTKLSLSTAFAQLTSTVGNKAHEMIILGTAESQVYSSALASMQAESGVNLDEEAANLIRYQQAYQAAGKMMQMASELFNVILQISN